MSTSSTQGEETFKLEVDHRCKQLLEGIESIIRLSKVFDLMYDLRLFSVVVYLHDIRLLFLEILNLNVKIQIDREFWY